ncbi:MAG TPA: hypothetical protein VGD21_00975 [Lysobacter sp.]
MAGLVQPAVVEVTTNADGSGNAFGNMVTARFADNDVEFIGCGIRFFDDGAGGTFELGFCQAANSADEAGFCQTTRPDLLEAMKATGDYSFITFAWNPDGECRAIGFSTQSFYIPDKNAK